MSVCTATRFIPAQAVSVDAAATHPTQQQHKTHVQNVTRNTDFCSFTYCSPENISVIM